MLLSIPEPSFEANTLVIFCRHSKNGLTTKSSARSPTSWRSQITPLNSTSSALAPLTIERPSCSSSRAFRRTTQIPPHYEISSSARNRWWRESTTAWTEQPRARLRAASGRWASLLALAANLESSAANGKRSLRRTSSWYAPMKKREVRANENVIPYYGITLCSLVMEAALFCDDRFFVDYFVIFSHVFFIIIINLWFSRISVKLMCFCKVCLDTILQNMFLFQHHTLHFRAT